MYGKSKDLMKTPLGSDDALEKMMQSDFVAEVAETTEHHKVSSKIKLSSFAKKQKVEISEENKAEKHPLII
jgi:hypothetical protein